MFSVSQRPRLESIKISGDPSTKENQQNKLKKYFLRGGKKLTFCYSGVAFATLCLRVCLLSLLLQITKRRRRGTGAPEFLFYNSVPFCHSAIHESRKALRENFLKVPRLIPRLFWKNVKFNSKTNPIGFKNSQDLGIKSQV